MDCLKIRQFGETESLNVSIAASIVMYEYVCQHA
jgi:tRNA (guanosine-2'-O-)-methyltransferase/TrmH family RNA methyltransferase